MAAQYPDREPFFAMKALRLLMKSGEVQRIGADGFALVTIIASTEDAKRYKGPVSYFNGQLLSVLGFGKWERLDNARRRAVEAGWLRYIAPSNGSRSAGYYWVLVPGNFADLPDTSIDESPDPLASFYHRGYRDGKEGRHPQPYPINGYGSGDDSREAYPEQGEGQNRPSPNRGYDQGMVEGMNRGNHLSYSFP